MAIYPFAGFFHEMALIMLPVPSTYGDQEQKFHPPAAKSPGKHKKPCPGTAHGTAGPDPAHLSARDAAAPAALGKNTGGGKFNLCELGLSEGWGDLHLSNPNNVWAWYILHWY